MIVYVKKEGSKRKKITAKSEIKLWEKMYNFYFPLEYATKTLNDLFPLFIDAQRADGRHESTIKKYINDYDNFYEDHPIMIKPLNKLTSDDVTSFINEAIVKHALTTKATHNMKTIMKNLCISAKSKNLVTERLYDTDTFNLNNCSVPNWKKETATERAIPKDSKEKLYAVLEDELRRKPNYTPVLAILLLFETALRIGELSYIKIDKIDLKGKRLYIRQSQDSNTKNEAKKLKTNESYRNIPLNTRAIEIIKKALILPVNSKPKWLLIC